MAIRMPDRAERSTADVMRAIATDTATLVRKEMELARQEITDAVAAKVKGAIFLVTAAVLALMGVVFVGITIGVLLDGVIAGWLAWLLTAVLFLAVAAVVAVVGRGFVRSETITPEATVKSVQEDVAWARTHLGR
jgi:uncharacterized membrane protein YqjE